MCEKISFHFQVFSPPLQFTPFIPHSITLYSDTNVGPCNAFILGILKDASVPWEAYMYGLKVSTIGPCIRPVLHETKASHSTEGI